MVDPETVTRLCNGLLATAKLVVGLQVACVAVGLAISCYLAWRDS